MLAFVSARNFFLICDMQFPFSPSSVPMSTTARSVADLLQLMDQQSPSLHQPLLVTPHSPPTSRHQHRPHLTPPPTPWLQPTTSTTVSSGGSRSTDAFPYSHSSSQKPQQQLVSDGHDRLMRRSSHSDVPPTPNAALLTESMRGVCVFDFIFNCQREFLLSSCLSSIFSLAQIVYDGELFYIRMCLLIVVSICQ